MQKGEKKSPIVVECLLLFFSKVFFLTGHAGKAKQRERLCCRTGLNLGSLLHVLPGCFLTHLTRANMSFVTPITYEQPFLSDKDHVRPLRDILHDCENDSSLVPEWSLYREQGHPAFCGSHHKM